MRAAAPLLAAVLGIALFTFMDAIMKGLSLEIGPYAAMVWRTAAGVAIAGPLLLRGRLAWPDRETLGLHLQRGGVNAFSAVCYFFGLTRLPMAEGIALAFLAPLVALYLAAAVLGEKVGVRGVAGSMLGGVGVLVLIGARMTGAWDGRALAGAGVTLGGAVLYGYGLILLRRQAQRANPVEVAFFQTGATLLWLLPAAPFLAPVPALALWPRLAAGALLAQVSIMLLAWAYARAEARRLIPVEYSGLLWAVLFGALMFGERLTGSMAIGAVLIVAGCLIAALAKPVPQVAEVGQ